MSNAQSRDARDRAEKSSKLLVHRFLPMRARDRMAPVARKRGNCRRRPSVPRLRLGAKNGPFPDGRRIPAATELHTGVRATLNCRRHPFRQVKGGRLVRSQPLPFSPSLRSAHTPLCSLNDRLHRSRARSLHPFLRRRTSDRPGHSPPRRPLSAWVFGEPWRLRVWRVTGWLPGPYHRLRQTI